MISLRHHWRLVAIAALLVVQLAAIGFARTADTRYLAWAPYDQISLYTVEVTRDDGTTVSSNEVVSRYPLALWEEQGRARGRENRSIAHVHHLIVRTESLLNDGPVTVVVRTSVNGGPEQAWTWPR